MEEHFIYSRPVVVTEDKLKEALAKQANQKALKAALDQQVLEAERLKAEAHRAKGRRYKKSSSSGSAPSPTSKDDAVKKNDLRGPSLIPPPPPPSSSPGVNAGPSSSIEPTRYTFSFNKGQATFEVTDSSVRPLQETLQPSSAEIRARAGNGDGAGPPSITSSNVKEKKRNVAIPTRRTPSSRDSAREGDGDSSGRGKRTASSGAGSGREYQRNSLPVNFKLGKEAVSGLNGGSGGSRPSRGASRDKDSVGGAKSGEEGGYDTQSLPVELIYKLSQGTALPNAAAVGASAGVKALSPLSRLKPPHPPRLTSPKRSPSTNRVSDSIGMRSPIGLPSAPPGSPGSAVRERSVPVSPREAKSGRLNTPLDGAGGVRPSARPAGGILPPLNGLRDSDVIEMSAILDTRTPIRENGGGGAPRGRTSSTPRERSSVASGTSPLSDVSTSEQARKLAERERGWAQQVKQLKTELRRARMKAGYIAHNSKAELVPDSEPRRAETAPDPPADPPRKAPRGFGVARPRRTEGGGGNNIENVGPARPSRLEKMDFTKAHIFNRETFRPITAPEDTSSYFGVLPGSPSPRTPLPPVQPKTSLTPHTTEGNATPVESDLYTQRTTTQNLADESLKLASLTTRQITLGLPEYGDGAPVPIQFLHLRQFVEAQIITENQAENLWEFFSLSVPAELGGSGGKGGADFFPTGGESSRRWSSGEGTYFGVPNLQRAEPNDEMETQTIEVEEITLGGGTQTTSLQRAEMSGDGHDAVRQTNGGGAETEKGGSEEEDNDDFFVPHSPTHVPINAVLAPALRRKISQLHSEEAALLLQHHQQLRNGRQHPSLVSNTKLKLLPAEKNSGREERARASPQRSSSPHNLSLSDRRGSHSSEPEETFDTFSELK